MPRWSVIVPVRNGESFVRRALSSTLRTLPKDAEVRVMDDGSTDRTPVILAEMTDRDRRLIVHRHDTGAGVAASLNELVAVSDSRYVARMDADDVALPGRWGLSEYHLRRHDMVFMSIVLIDASGRPRGTDQPGSFSARALPLHLLLGSMLVHPTASMRRESLAALDGYRTVAAEDYDLWLRAAGAGQRLLRSAVPGLLYRRHDGQVTKAGPWRGDDATSPLWASYRALARTAGVDLGADDAAAARVMLGADALTPTDAALRTLLMARIGRRGRATLRRSDFLQLQARLLRERRRTTSRTVVP